MKRNEDLQIEVLGAIIILKFLFLLSIIVGGVFLVIK